MNALIVKKKPGQSGSADTNAYLRQDRIEIRVSPHEKKWIVQQSKDQNFESVAHYVRCQAISPRSENPNAQRQAQYACLHQLNRIGNNINQIARHLNSGANPDNEILSALKQIQQSAEALVKQTDSKSAGAK